MALQVLPELGTARWEEEYQSKWRNLFLNTHRPNIPHTDVLARPRHKGRSNTITVLSLDVSVTGRWWLAYQQNNYRATDVACKRLDASYTFHSNNVMTQCQGFAFDQVVYVPRVSWLELLNVLCAALCKRNPADLNGVRATSYVVCLRMSRRGSIKGSVFNICWDLDVLSYMESVVFNLL